METKMKGNDKVYHIIAFIIVAALAVAAVIPVLLIVVASFTDENVLVANGYSFIPSKISFNAYLYMVNQIGTILRAYGISIAVTVIGTVLALILTSMLAYPLSRSDFRFRNVISFMIFFTMLFNGGVVPSYIMWSRIFHVNNTIWALILPNFLVTAYNVFLARNYYAMNVPPALIESAKIDGAGELTIYFRIMLPLSKPVLATIGLFTGVIYWNDWINSMYYITKPQMYSIQYYLMVLMQNIQFLQSGNTGMNVAGAAMQMPSTAIRMALAVIGVLPILIIFPFIQKHLVKGVVMGAVKG